MQSWISPAKRADVEREWERAKGWAEHSQVPFPWTSIDARDYALHILREYGIALDLKRGPGGEPVLADIPSKIGTVRQVGDKLNESTFNWRLGPVDTMHVAAGHPPPWQSAKVEFHGWWKQVKRLYLTRQRLYAKDALLLPDLLVILSGLARPGPRELRDAALVAMAGDPRLALDTASGGRLGWSFLADIETSTTLLYGDGSVTVRAAHQRGFAGVHIPAGASATAIRRLVLWQQPQKALAGRLVFDPGGCPERDLDAWDGPLLVSYGHGGIEGQPMNATALRKATEAAVSGRVDRNRDWTMTGNRLVLSVPPDRLEKIVAELDRPSLAALRDGAWLSNGWWLGGRGMEVIGREWGHVHMVENGVEWDLPRKGDSSGRRVKYAVPHLSLTFADPLRWLHLLRERLDVQHRALSGRRLTDSDPVLPSNLSEPTSFAAKPTEFSKRLKELLVSQGIDGDVASHSLRIGCANSLRKLGVPEDKVMLHLDWSDLNQYRGYFRDTHLHDTSTAIAEAAAAAGLGPRRERDEDDFMFRLRRIVNEAKAAGQVCACRNCQGEWTVAAILGAEQTEEARSSFIE